MKLEQNYRSTQTILDAAHAVVSRNGGARTRSSGPIAGPAQITLFDAYNEYEEAEFVARQVEKLVGGARRGGMTALLTSRADDEDGSLRYGDIAVGYRINAQSACWKRRSCASASRTSSSAGSLLRAARGEGRARLRPAGAQPSRSGGAAADHQRAGAGHRREDGRGADAWAESRGVSLWEAVLAAGENPNLATRSRAQLGASPT